jgi:hypothetical protein
LNDDILGVSFPEYERIYVSQIRTFILVDNDYFKKKKSINFFSFSSKKEILEFKELQDKGLKSSDCENFNVELIKNPKLKKLCACFKAYNEIKAIHLSFRPKTRDIIMLKTIFPNITHIFMSKSYMDSMGDAAIDFLITSWKIEVEICSILGARIDLGAIFKIEVYV